jgi:hypothetical protein
MVWICCLRPPKTLNWGATRHRLSVTVYWVHSRLPTISKGTRVLYSNPEDALDIISIIITIIAVGKLMTFKWRYSVLMDFACIFPALAHVRFVHLVSKWMCSHFLLSMNAAVPFCRVPYGFKAWSFSLWRLLNGKPLLMPSLWPGDGWCRPFFLTGHNLFL